MKPIIISAASIFSIALSLTAIFRTRHYARMASELMEENLKLRALLFRACFILPENYSKWHQDTISAASLGDKNGEAK